jgi:brefeldin A-inhibited guanine nucleotide-exchange protein 3
MTRYRSNYRDPILILIPEFQVTEIINNKFISLSAADYSGPLTYQSYRLPQDYQQIVASLEIKQGLIDSDTENDQHELESNCSGETAGPDNNSDVGDNSSDDISKIDWYSNMDDLHIDMKSDRDHAKEFSRILKQDLVPKLVKLRTSVEIDEAIQQFASNICIQNCLNFSDFDYNLTAINADGIYLVTYRVFILSLQLMELGHYAKCEGQIQIPISEQGFVQSVQNCGILVLLSGVWLRELYQQILVANPLELLTMDHCALIDMIKDVSSCGFLSEFSRLRTFSLKIKHEKDNEKQVAGKKLARRLLTCCWDSLLTILSAGLDIQESKTGRLLKKTLAPNSKRSNGDSVYALSLEGLHKLAVLSNSLHLQHLAGKVLTLIATNVCSNDSPKLSAATALSMETILTKGLDLAAISPSECFPPIFQVVRYLGQYEHEMFSQSISGNPMPMLSNDSPQKGSNNNSSNYVIDDDETW